MEACQDLHVDRALDMEAISILDDDVSEVIISTNDDNTRMLKVNLNQILRKELLNQK